MKSPLLKRVHGRRTLERAWRAIEENARTSSSEVVRNEVQKFAEDPGHNIDSISHRLARGHFEFIPAKGIPIPKTGSDGKKSKTKFRPIVLAPLESRIVQRAILEALLPHTAIQKYSNSPNSFGGIKRQAGRELAAVPAAIQEILVSIENGARFVAFADIRAFFTKIPKQDVHNLVATAVNDPDFMKLFDSAIKVELSNMAELREKANDFPIEEIGVAQGNSLSPLLGNILLYEFDQLMNQGDCRCIRYIDDFIILAPSFKAAKARMKLATQLLNAFGMELSPEKSTAKPIPITKSFVFLGIEFNNGLLRPSQKSRNRIIEAIGQSFAKSAKAMANVRNGAIFDKKESLVHTLKRVDGMVQGWGKHYYFCNDRVCLRNIEMTMRSMVNHYWRDYEAARAQVEPEDELTILGVERLGTVDLTSLVWPKMPTANVAV